MVRTESNSSQSSGEIRLALWALRSRPRAAALLWARSSGGLPTCQEPVPAESTKISSSNSSRRSTSSKTPWANGERQILPKQTNRTRTICAQSTSYLRQHLAATLSSHAPELHLALGKVGGLLIHPVRRHVGTYCYQHPLTQCELVQFLL